MATCIILNRLHYRQPEIPHYTYKTFFIRATPVYLPDDYYEAGEGMVIIAKGNMFQGVQA